MLILPKKACLYYSVQYFIAKKKSSAARNASWECVCSTKPLPHGAESTNVWWQNVAAQRWGLQTGAAIRCTVGRPRGLFCYMWRKHYRVRKVWHVPDVPHGLLLSILSVSREQMNYLPSKWGVRMVFGEERALREEGAGEAKDDPKCAKNVPCDMWSLNDAIATIITRIFWSILQDDILLFCLDLLCCPQVLKKAVFTSCEKSTLSEAFEKAEVGTDWFRFNWTE